MANYFAIGDRVHGRRRKLMDENQWQKEDSASWWCVIKNNIINGQQQQQQQQQQQDRISYSRLFSSSWVLVSLFVINNDSIQFSAILLYLPTHLIA